MTELPLLITTESPVLHFISNGAVPPEGVAVTVPLVGLAQDGKTPTICGMGQHESLALNTKLGSSGHILVGAFHEPLSESE